MALSSEALRAVRSSAAGFPPDVFLELVYAIDRSRRIVIPATETDYRPTFAETNGAIFVVAPRANNLSIYLPKQTQAIPTASGNSCRVHLLGDVATDKYVQVVSPDTGYFFVGAATIVKSTGVLEGHSALEADSRTIARWDGATKGGKRGDWAEFFHLEATFWHANFFGRAASTTTSSPFTPDVPGA